MSKKLSIFLCILFVLAAFFVFGYFSDGNNFSLFKSVVFKSSYGQSAYTLRTVFVGDIMLDRGVSSYAKRNGKESVFDGVKHLFVGADAVIGNLEGTVSTRESIAVLGSSILRFTFDPDFMPILHNIGFTAVSLANNHSLDFGHDGDTETREYVHRNDILTFGSALNSRDLSSSITLKDGAFCLVGYHDLFIADPTNVIAEIIKIKPACKHVAIFVHWGEEYTHIPNSRQRILARSFVDAGADLIIGAHPHVVQPVEIYKNKAIFYSLGNFIFDQNFSFDTMHGLAVNIEWGKDRTRFELIPVAISKGRVTVAEDEARDKVLQTVVDSRTSADITKSILEVGEFTIDN